MSKRYQIMAIQTTIMDMEAVIETGMETNQSNNDLLFALVCITL